MFTCTLRSAALSNQNTVIFQFKHSDYLTGLEVPPVTEVRLFLSGGIVYPEGYAVTTVNNSQYDAPSLLFQLMGLHNTLMRWLSL